MVDFKLNENLKSGRKSSTKDNMIHQNYYEKASELSLHGLHRDEIKRQQPGFRPSVTMTHICSLIPYC